MTLEYLEPYIASNVFIPVSLLLVFLLTSLFLFMYKFLAQKAGIISQMNERTLHKTEKPRGGGIVFSFIFIISIICFFFLGFFKDQLILLVSCGCIVASIFGFLDDILDIKAVYKLMVQILLGVWIIYLFSINSVFPLYSIANYYWLFFAGILFILVWVFNVFNFMDGIDGLLVSGCFISLLIANLLLTYNGGSTENSIIILLLATVCLSFLVFNFPPASIFMGDSGSLFLGYTMIAIALKTYLDADLSFWTWGILFGYFLADTFITTTTRLFTIKKWYGEHRSHAYQNLAKLWDSHFKITTGVIMYQLLWLAPLAFFSTMKPEYGFVLFLFATFPVILLTLNYGPSFSNK